MDHPGPAAVRETHAGLVLLFGDRAYKLKKPVRTAYLDFSTPNGGARRSAGSWNSTAGSPRTPTSAPTSMPTAASPD